MSSKSGKWYPIAVILAALNLAAVGLAATPWWHATSHAALALGFGLWAQYLRRRPVAPEQLQSGDEPSDQLTSGESLAALEAEMSRLREELSETQERLDFTERMLAQRADPRRMGASPDKT